MPTKRPPPPSATPGLRSSARTFSPQSLRHLLLDPDLSLCQLPLRPDSSASPEGSPCQLRPCSGPSSQARRHQPGRRPRPPGPLPAPTPAPLRRDSAPSPPAAPPSQRPTRPTCSGRVTLNLASCPLPRLSGGSSPQAMLGEHPGSGLRTCRCPARGDSTRGAGNSRRSGVRSPPPRSPTRQGPRKGERACAGRPRLRPAPPPPAEVWGLTAPAHQLERRKDAESRVLAETHLQEAGRRRHWRRGGP